MGKGSAEKLPVDIDRFLKRVVKHFQYDGHVCDPRVPCTPEECSQRLVVKITSEGVSAEYIDRPSLTQVAIATDCGLLIYDSRLAPGGVGSQEPRYPGGPRVDPRLRFKYLQFDVDKVDRYLLERGFYRRPIQPLMTLEKQIEDYLKAEPLPEAPVARVLILTGHNDMEGWQLRIVNDPDKNIKWIRLGKLLRDPDLPRGVINMILIDCCKAGEILPDIQLPPDRQMALYLSTWAKFARANLQGSYFLDSITTGLDKLGGLPDRLDDKVNGVTLHKLVMIHLESKVGNGLDEFEALDPDEDVGSDEDQDRTKDNDAKDQDPCFEFTPNFMGLSVALYDLARRVSGATPQPK